MSTRRGPAALLLVLLLAALTGCVSIPTSGPVDKVEGQQPTCQSCVNVEVAPPYPGDTGREVVEGFLRANANYQSGYAVARQFLTRDAASTWTTDQGVVIYSVKPNKRPDVEGSVRLQGQRVGSLDKRNTFKAAKLPLDYTFELVREGGEWRISNPLPGLLVRDSSFERLYRSYNLYYPGGTGALVPEPIYLPDLRAPGNIASALVQALLAGPSDWLSPAVQTAVPSGTKLSVDSVTIVNGVAQVPLSDEVQRTTDPERASLAAQLVYTLQQVTGVKKVLLQVGGQPFRVPQSDSTDLAVPLESISSELNPVPFVPSEQLYAVRGPKSVLQKVTVNTDVPAMDPFPGPLGEGRYSISSLAATVTNTEVAVVTDEDTVLRRTAVTGGRLTTVLDGVTSLLRPQFTRAGELFAVGVQNGQQRMWVTNPDGETRAISASDVFSHGRVVAFRISPDGARMALIMKSAGKTQLATARVVRSPKLVVDGWRLLETDSPLTDAAVIDARDLAWTSATELVVLGADRADGSYGQTAVSVDASTVQTQLKTSDWEAVELAVLLRTQTAITLVLARDGAAYRDEGNRWLEILDDTQAIAYPG
ncbi:LpqB family beta-propeller domain-containing protein [Microlunatus capsulatus]|uniref:GerMN domain-containing protein n=1 Tax=Microlunatus capsulatus TaxID=99117 RepID=A0ABS4Z4S5_9ACTN|nr:LpqB family beta-propeller domain-containing protein [Microlunatus capsulatus]MBP2415800.1 hypothetical protein [Microlunatus capsulatus]